MKKLIMLIPILLLLIGNIQAQEAKKVEEKKVVIVKKTTDKSGKVIEERIEATGADADKLLKEMKEYDQMDDIDIEIIKKEGIQIEKKKTSSVVSISKNGRDSKTVEVNVTGNDDDSSTIVIKIQDPETGEFNVNTWKVMGEEYPEDLKKIMEEENIVIDSDHHSKSMNIDIEKDSDEDGKVIFRINKDGMDESKVIEWISEGGEFPIDLEKMMEKDGNVFKFGNEDGEMRIIQVESDDADLPEVKVRMGVKVLGMGEVKIAEVSKGSSADKAGLKDGDIITEIDDYSITNHRSLMKRLSNYKAGDKIKVRFIRDGKANNTSLKLVGID